MAGVNWVEKVRPIFVDFLNNSAVFAAKLQFLSTDQKQQFITRTQSRQQTVNDFLNILEVKQHEEGIFMQVMQALKTSGQQHVAEMIQYPNTEHMELLQQRRVLLQILSPQLVDNIGHPEDMIPHLPCLTEEEGNELQACKDMHGDQQTVMKMLFFLVLKGPEMYGQLITALEKTKQPPKLVQALKDMVESDSFSHLPIGQQKFSGQKSLGGHSVPLPVMPLSSTIGIAGHEDDKMKLEDTGKDLKDMTVASNSETRSSQPTKALNVETQHEQDSSGSYVAKLAEALRTHYNNTMCQKQLYPWKQDKVINLNETFVHLTMDKEIPKTGKSIKQRLRTHEEIFTKDGTDRRFVLEGRPGLGKTTMCAKTAYDWSRGRALGHIVLLFVLRLGLINRNTTIEEAIVEQLNIPLELSDHQKLSKTLNDSGNSIVIVLDALDEADPDLLFDQSQKLPTFDIKWKLGLSTILVMMLAVFATANVMVSAFICALVVYAITFTYYRRAKLHNIVDIMKFNSKGLKQCQVLVTTRPWRVTQIMKILEYKHLELQPFVKVDIETYMKRFFEYSTLGLGGRLISNYIKNNKLMVDASIPLITLLICWYWQETEGKCEIPERRSKLYDEIIHIMCKKATLEKELQQTSIVNGLGAIALQGLMPHKTILVFSEKECSKYCSKEILDAACKTGITSKKGDQKNSITFFHKSAQEHLAGKYLANHQGDLQSYLGEIKTVQDALTIGPVLLSAAAENTLSAEQVLGKLMEIFRKEFDPSKEARPRGPNDSEDRMPISNFYDGKLAIKDIRKIQQFIELCIECNYEANVGEKFTSKLVKTLFPRGKVYFFGIAPYPAVALGYFLSHIKATEEEKSPINFIKLTCAPHPCDPQVFNGPVRELHRDKLKEVKYVPSDDEVREDVEKWKKNEKRKHGNLHEALDRLPATEMLAYIQTIQESDGLPSVSDTNVAPIVKSFSNSSIKLTELHMAHYQSGFMELLKQIRDGHMESLRVLKVSSMATTTGDQMTKLANMVHKISNIEELQIFENKIEEGKTLPALAQNLPNCKFLNILSISDYHAPAGDMKIFAEKLPVQGQSDSIESDGKFGHRLKILFIKGNYINDEVATVLSARLPQTLTGLGMSLCGKNPKDLSPEKHNELLKALQNLPCLERLRIYNSPYPVDLVKYVFDGLASWKKISRLTLDVPEEEDKQPLPSAVSEAMVKSLDECPVEELRLSGIRLPKGFFERLMEVGKKKDYYRFMYPRKYVSTEEESLACQEYEFVVLE